MVFPALISAPAVFLGFSAHRKHAATQWSAPVAPGGGSAERQCNPLRITVRSRNGSSGFQLKGRTASKGPSLLGTQYAPGAIPCGTKQPTKRGLGTAAVAASAVEAGIMASKSGSARGKPVAL